MFFARPRKRPFDVFPPRTSRAPFNMSVCAEKGFLFRSILNWVAFFFLCEGTKLRKHCFPSDHLTDSLLIVMFSEWREEKKENPSQS